MLLSEILLSGHYVFATIDTTKAYFPKAAYPKANKNDIVIPNAIFTKASVGSVTNENGICDKTSSKGSPCESENKNRCGYWWGNPSGVSRELSKAQQQQQNRSENNSTTKRCKT